MPENNIPSPTENQGLGVREGLAKKISTYILWGTIAIGIVGIAFAITAIALDKNHDVKEAFGIVQYVFGALLPLWGTWIGTVLAYYFAKENFESANRNVRELVDKITSEKKLEGIKASDVMEPLAMLTYKTIKAGETLAVFKLNECLKSLDGKKNRLLILDEANCAKHVIHRDMISFFIANEAIDNKTVVDLTLQDMRDNGNEFTKRIFDGGIGFIKPDDNLLKAKEIMDGNSACQDVFVTKDGAASNPVIGWVTNKTITENSKV